MDDALNLAREFEHVMCRFRRMDYSVLHPGVGNMEFAVLEMIHKLSAQHDAIYGAAISDLQKKWKYYRRHFPDCSVAWRKKGCACAVLTRKIEEAAMFR